MYTVKAVAEDECQETMRGDFTWNALGYATLITTTIIYCRNTNQVFYFKTLEVLTDVDIRMPGSQEVRHRSDLDTRREGVGEQATRR